MTNSSGVVSTYFFPLYKKNRIENHENWCGNLGTPMYDSTKALLKFNSFKSKYSLFRYDFNGIQNL